MSLLGSIAAALSEGVGGGMVQNAKLGEEHEAQAKKEAADNARLQEQLKRYDADRESREKIYGMQAEEGKADREARAKESAADRDLQWRIANLNNSRRGSGGRRYLRVTPYLLLTALLVAVVVRCQAVALLADCHCR